MGADELVSLLVRLINAPDDALARRNAIDALEARGLRSEAASLLASFINFTGHEESPPLPCLCKACIASAPETATADGLSFTRAFVVSGTRVLHFWLPEELAGDRAEVRRAVGERLRARLARKRRKVKA
ncbi:MAG: hypothetical protein AB7T06_18960 [Kofleriaceae bacterium]